MAMCGGHRHPKPHSAHSRTAHRQPARGPALSRCIADWSRRQHPASRAMATLVSVVAAPMRSGVGSRRAPLADRSDGDEPAAAWWRPNTQTQSNVLPTHRRLAASRRPSPSSLSARLAPAAPGASLMIAVLVSAVAAPAPVLPPRPPQRTRIGAATSQAAPMHFGANPPRRGSLAAQVIGVATAHPPPVGSP
jgi:hypothetical protein